MHKKHKNCNTHDVDTRDRCLKHKHEAHEIAHNLCTFAEAGDHARQRKATEAARVRVIHVLVGGVLADARMACAAMNFATHD